MRVAPEVIQSVAFIGIEVGGRFTPIATGALMAVPYEGHEFTVLATARHILDDHAKSRLSYRLNRRSGGCDTIPLDMPPVMFDDPAIDVAFIPVSPGFEVYEYTSTPLDRVFWKLQREKLEIDAAPGDEVSVIGLYSSHHGLTRNLPVVRIGRIAALPVEPVITPRGHAFGYLVELHSILGLSGSPVFQNIFPLRVKDGVISAIKRTLYFPLGIQVGYHLVESKEDQILVPQHQGDPVDQGAGRPYDPLRSDELRTGFSVVVPFERLLELAESPMWQNAMKASVEAARARSGHSPSGLPSPVQGESKISD